MASLVGLKTMKHPEDIIAWGIELDVRSRGLGKPKMFATVCLQEITPLAGKLHTPHEEATMPQSGPMCAGAERMQRLTLMPGLKISKSLKGSKSLKLSESFPGGDPIVTLPKEYITDGIMVVGGAAGQSGIGYAMRAGQICGDVAAECHKKRRCLKICSFRVPENLGKGI